MIEEGLTEVMVEDEVEDLAGEIMTEEEMTEETWIDETGERTNQDGPDPTITTLWRSTG